MDTDRAKLVENLEAAVSAAKDAIDQATDAVGVSRRTTRRVRRAIRESKAQDVVDLTAAPDEAL